MKFGADVTSLTARKGDNDQVYYAAFEAADEREAVRKVADWYALARYGDGAQSSWIEAKDGEPGAYLSFVGIGGHRSSGYVMDGVTIEVRLYRVE